MNFLTPIKDTWLKYGKSKVVVLGNGTSRVEGIELALREALPCISINELPSKLDLVFSVATRPHLLFEMEKNNIMSTPIFVPSSFPPTENSVRLPVAELSYLEGAARTLSDDMEFREDFVLLTILHLMDRIAQESGKIKEVIQIDLYGFDFELNPVNKHESSNDFLNSLLQRQRSIYEMLIKDYDYHQNISINNRSRNAPLKAEKTYNSINKKVPTLSTNKLELAIQKNNKLIANMFEEAISNNVQVIAELTNNHLGDTGRLVEMVELCKDQGASAVKIQKRDIQVLYTQNERDSFYESPFGNTLGDYRAGVELDISQIEYLTTLCADLEIPWFTSVLDLPSFQAIKRFNPLCVKAPSTISNHRNFLLELASSEIEYIFISTGATDETYLNWIVETFAHKKTILMQCTSSYPTAPNDCNVAVVGQIKNLKSQNKIIPGYSSHDVGSLASQLAIAFGARFIEKHVKLGSIDWIHFDGVALDLLTDDLKKFVSDLEYSRNIIGDGKKRELLSEHHKYTPNENHN